MSDSDTDLRRARGHNADGLTAAAQGRNADAIAAFRSAIASCLNFAEPHNNLGIALASARQLDAALDAFANASAVDPHWPDPLNNLGVVLQSLGRLTSAVEAFQRAIALRSNYPEAHFNLGNAQRDLANLHDAIRSYRAAISFRADYADARLNLAQALQSAGRITEAIDAWRLVLKQRPSFAAGHHQLGRLLHQGDTLSEATVALRRALMIAPDDADVHHDLGNVLVEQGIVEQGISAYQKAIRFRPSFADAYYNLGNALSLAHRDGEAIEAFRRAIEHRPADPRSLNNLGNLLQSRGDLDEAIASFVAATNCGHPAPEYFSNLGNALKEVGRIDEAIQAYDRAIKIDPSNASWASHRLYALHFSASCSPEQLLTAHVDWDATYAAALPAARRVERGKTPQHGKLRIGYISGDFREHVVGRNLLPLLREHDRDHFEIFCYANQLRCDAMTEQFKSYSHSWCDIRHLDDEAAARLIAADEIDILIDLSLHMAGNRLLVFARRPAPVQITFAGYPSGTGLAAMDERLTDPQLDPPGTNDAYYRERSIRLPHSFWCFEPTGTEPEVGPLPADRNDHVTFGCFNNFCKVNAATLQRWAGVLSAAPNSRLMLQAPRGSARDRVLQTLSRHGVEASRVSFVERLWRRDYLALYNTVDVALDTLPYNGHTTSLEGMWMGVPLITRVGTSAVGRAGLSLLTNVGLSELCAATDEHMARIAVGLAGDLSRLRDLRAGLRARIVASPLGDARGFARAIEAAYRRACNRMERRG